MRAEAILAQWSRSAAPARSIRSNVSVRADTGRVLYLARRYDEAITELRSTLELERAYRQNDPRLVFLKVDPAFDTLRDDARFQRLLRDIGL